jgi:HD-GYP domain-containing protein (c-di-GMP phosphodiesterase class II)
MDATAGRVIRRARTGFLLPLAAGCGAAIVANRLLPDAHRAITVIPRTLVIVATSMTVIALLDRTVRRLLPLATLLQLSLVFPDQAPSRLRIALRSSNRRRVRQLVTEATDNGLADNPAVAAEQVMLLVAALGDHDRHTRGHSERVRLYADMIGREMRLTKEERQKLQWGALLHDLGKLHLASTIIDKKGPLDANEWILVRRHPEQGRRLLRPLVPFLGEWAEAVWNHHERWDGAGYPEASEAIASVARQQSSRSPTASRR